MQYANLRPLLVLKHHQFRQMWQYHHQTRAKYLLDVRPSQNNAHHQLKVLCELLLQQVHNFLYQGPVHEIYKATCHLSYPQWLPTIFYMLLQLISFVFFLHLSLFQPFLPPPHLFSCFLIVCDRPLHEVFNQIHDHDLEIFLNHQNKNEEIKNFWVHF